MVKRFDPRVQREVDIELAGPNPTSPPPVEPGFLYHLSRIGERINQQLRPHWMSHYGCFAIQELQPNGEWRNVYLATDDIRSHEGNMRPYHPLDMRIVDDFANCCLEIKYNTGDLEKDRVIDQAARDAVTQMEEHDEHEAGVVDIARRLTRGINGAKDSDEDNKRAAKAMRYSSTVINDGTGFKEFFQVPAKKGVVSSTGVEVVEK